MKRHIAGFGLTEVLIALLVVAVAIVPIYGLLTSNARQVAFNQDRAVAQILATQVLERYRYVPYEELVTAFSTFESGKAVIGGDTVLQDLMVELVDEPGAEGMYRRYGREAMAEELVPGQAVQFTVRVTWKNSQGQDRVYEWRTLIRNTEWHDTAH